MDANIWAILVAVIINMAVGFVWYSKPLFANAWAKATGKNMEEMGSGTPGYIITIVASIVQYCILAYVLQQLGKETFMEGAVTGLLIWLAFVATTHAVNFVFENRPIKLYAINTGYFLVTLVINGGLLAAWQ